MQIDLASIARRAHELFAAREFDRAWEVIEPVADQVSSDRDLASIWLALSDREKDAGKRVRLATAAIGSFGDDLPLVMDAADTLTGIAEERPFDEEPLAEGPAQIAADALRRVEHLAVRLDREDRVGFYAALAMALRMTGSKDDREALDAMQHAIDLEPSNAESWYKVGLLHKWRGRWVEGVEANRRALTLGSDTEAVRWNLLICATGLGDLATAISTSEVLGVHVSAGDDGLPFGGFGAVQVRVSSLGQGIDPQAHVSGRAPRFENVWIERRSLCHGVIVNATYYDLCADYGDAVLFDGAPVGYRVDGETRVPRFPLLQKLREGAYRRYRFAGVQPRAGAIQELENAFPDGARFYVHDEQTTFTCHECAAKEVTSHVHPHEHLVVTGKLVAPMTMPGVDVTTQLAAIQAGNPIQIAVPDLFEELGQPERAKQERALFEDIISRRSDPGPRVVQCQTHGKSHPTFVCRHLRSGEGLGFFAADSEDDPRPDAWCGECERVRLEQGGAWNDVSEAQLGVTMICEQCYDLAKARNARKPVAARSHQPQQIRRWWEFWKR